MLSKSQVEAAQKLYLNGDYAEAAANYDSLLAKEPNNAYLLVNSGNADYSNGSYGTAIAKYYQAKKFIPRDKDLNHNLEMTLNAVKLEQPAMLGYNYMTLAESFILLLLANLVFIFRRKLLVKTALRYLAIVVFVFCLLNFGFIAYSQEIKNHAVVISSSAHARSGNNAAYPELFELLSGQIVEILREDSDWSEITKGDKRGWLSNTELDSI